MTQENICGHCCHKGGLGTMKACAHLNIFGPSKNNKRRMMIIIVIEKKVFNFAIPLTKEINDYSQSAFYLSLQR